MNETPKRYRFRFSLRTLLIIMTLIAFSIVCYMVGYWHGHMDAFTMYFEDNLRQALQE